MTEVARLRQQVTRQGVEIKRLTSIEHSGRAARERGQREALAELCRHCYYRSGDDPEAVRKAVQGVLRVSETNTRVSRRLSAGRRTGLGVRAPGPVMCPRRGASRSKSRSSPRWGIRSGIGSRTEDGSWRGAGAGGVREVQLSVASGRVR
jgi:hypothetical protein